jgi:hypothetical protein
LNTALRKPFSLNPPKSKPKTILPVDSAKRT